MVVMVGPASTPAKAGHYRDHRVDAQSRVVSGFSRTQMTASKTPDRIPASFTAVEDSTAIQVDGEAVLDEGAPHESKVCRVKLSAGKDRIKIEYYEAGGFAKMRFDIQRK
jgi:hypothetical protein